MPDDVEIYVLPEGEKIHLRSTCAGENANKKIIDEKDFLEILEKGEGCKRCCSPVLMIDFVKMDLKQKGR